MYIILNTQVITYLNLYGSGLHDVGSISSLKSLTVCLIANNYITDLSPVLKCRNIFKLDASTNKVSITFACSWSLLVELLYSVWINAK